MGTLCRGVYGNAWGFLINVCQPKGEGDSDAVGSARWLAPRSFLVVVAKFPSYSYGFPRNCLVFLRHPFCLAYCQKDHLVSGVICAASCCHGAGAMALEAQREVVRCCDGLVATVPCR